MQIGGTQTLRPLVERLSSLFQEMYARAGLCATVTTMPGKRLESLVASGQLDADWLRADEYLLEHDLGHLAIPQPVVSVDALLFWLPSDQKQVSPDSLNGLTIGYQFGYEWFEKNLPRNGAKPFAIQGLSQVPNLLNRDRIDAYATLGIVAGQLIRDWPEDMALPRKTVRKRMPFYHYVAPHNKDKIPRLNTALRDMIREGAVAKYLTADGFHPAALVDETQTPPFQKK